MRRLLVVLSVALVAVLGSACGDRDGGRMRVRLQTTTSPRDSGLLDWLTPEIEKRGVTLHVIAVGTGQALENARRGDGDLVIVHDREKEDAFVKEGSGVERKDLMWNDFLIVGPPTDPAGVRGMKDAPAALKKIADARAGFVSRGDDSGTHSREKRLWKKAGGRPSWDGYVEAGQGMGPVLVMASEKQSYTLTDRGTYVSAKRRLDLQVLVEGDRALANSYGVILVNPAKVTGVNEKGARIVSDYLTSPEGQAKIAAFRVAGEPIFHAGAPD